MLPASTISDESSPIHSTINEPIKKTIMRDLRSIGKKFKHVLVPAEEGTNLSRDWDLWGPFILCLVLSVVLATQAADNQKGYVFALVYVFVFAGSGIVTLNALLIKGRVSFLQTVCVLGYCTLPLATAAVGCWFVNHSLNNPVRQIVKLALVSWGVLWSTKASVGFMAGLVPDDRKALGVYPVWLLYVVISWIVFVT